MIVIGGSSDQDQECLGAFQEFPQVCCFAVILKELINRCLLEISKCWHYLNHCLVPSYLLGLRIGCRTRVFSFAVAFK